MSFQQQSYIPQSKRQMEDFDVIKKVKLPKTLTGNIFIFGRIGGGKSWKILTIVQGFHELGFKVIHMFGGKRSENTWWCFPSEETKLWRDFEISVGALSKPGPKEYEVNLLYPMFSTQLPNKLPDLKPRIRSKIFTIPLKSITLQHISLVVGDISNRGKAIYQTIQKNTDKYSNGADVEFLFNTILKKHKDNSMYTLFFKPLIENNLIGSDYDENNLNMEDECNNKKVVSVLCHDFIPKEFQYFIMGYMMTTMMDLINKDKIPKKNIAMFNEVSMFMKVTDKSAENEVTTQIFRNLITDVARYARSGLFFAMDTQSPAEVKNLISGCLTSDTNIQIFDKKIKNKKIFELPNSFKVLSYNFKNNKIEIKPARKKYIGKKEVYKIYFEDGFYVNATSEHRFFNKKNKEIEVSKLKKGDKLLFIDKNG